MSVGQKVHAQGTKYGTSARLAYLGGYYQQQQALTLIDQLRIRAWRFRRIYYQQRAIMLNTRAGTMLMQERYFRAQRIAQWNNQQYRRVLENIKKLQQQQNGSGNNQTVRR